MLMIVQITYHWSIIFRLDQIYIRPLTTYFEMLMINMGVYSEQSLEDGLGIGEEVVGEGDTNLAGEQ